MKALSASSWVTVCKESDLLPNEGVCVRVGTEQVAVFYLPGCEYGLYAIGNHDPIGNANVLSRGIVGDINGEPVVASPLYKQHFSLISGVCLEDTSVTVPVYEIARDNGAILVGEL